MAYVIAIVAVLMVLGSVLWLKPSKAQLRQTKLRLLARQLGLDVRLCSLPQGRRARVREEHPEQGVVYRLPVFERHDPPPPTYLLCRTDATAPWLSAQDEPLTAELQALIEKVSAELPADTVALELGPQGPAVYWRERGDENTLRRLHRALVELRDSPLSASA
jgi:hypothetical protein